ncbi:MAG: FtsQ-type POTRA domain-containing protein [Pseudomonadota bacterium]
MAAFLFGSASAGLAYTDEPAQLWDTVGQAGFRLTEIEFGGQYKTSLSAVVAAVGLGPGMTLLGLDVDEARQKLEALPWVRKATVRKALPGKLIVSLEEAEAFARWNDGFGERLIASDGAVLSDGVPAEYRGLPLVAGGGANDAVSGIRLVLAAHPNVDQRTLAAVRVNDRRWDLKLDNGATVHLPAGAEDAALLRLTQLHERGSLMDLAGSAIDLRLPDRTSVRLKPAEEAAPRILASVRAAPADPLAAAIAEASAAFDDPLARAIREARIP